MPELSSDLSRGFKGRRGHIACGGLMLSKSQLLADFTWCCSMPESIEDPTFFEKSSLSRFANDLDYGI